MKLNNKDFARFQALQKLMLAGKIAPGSKEEAEFAKLSALKAGSGGSKKGGNSPEWYKRYPGLFRDTTNVVFNSIAGSPVNSGFATTSRDNFQYLTAGVRFAYIPTIGFCEKPNDPFNFQMRDLWLTLHRAYRGIGSYEYCDLGITIYAILAVFADIARAERIYGVFNKFYARNRSLPGGVLDALGVDAVTRPVGANLATFRYSINRAIAKAQALCLPKGMTIFEQYISLSAFVFKDSDNVRAQWFVFDNPYKLIYDATNISTGGAIRYEARSKASVRGQTFEDIINDINEQLDILLNDSDIARMCSDILKAFGDNGTIKVNELPENYEVEPIKDETRLLQLHNTVFIGTPVGLNMPAAINTDLTTLYGSVTKANQTVLIYQQNGHAVQKIGCGSASGDIEATLGSTWQLGPTGYGYWVSGFGSSHEFLTGHVLLDTWKDEVTPDDLVDMTRQSLNITSATFSSGTNSYYHFYPVTYSTYMIIGWKLYTGYNGASSDHPYEARYNNSGSRNALEYTSIATANTEISKVAQWSMIQWHPWFSVVYTGTGGTQREVFWAMDNYAVIDGTYIDKIHDACTMSLFMLPAFATPVKD